MGILIAYILGILAAVKSKNQDGDTHHTAADCHEQQNSPNRNLSVICIPPTPSKEQETERQKTKRRQTIKFRVEMFSALILFVYAGFTALMYCANQKAADAAKQSADAYMEGESARIVIDFPWEYSPNEKRIISVRNHGITIAENVRWDSASDDSHTIPCGNFWFPDWKEIDERIETQEKECISKPLRDGSTFLPNGKTEQTGEIIDPTDPRMFDGQLATVYIVGACYGDVFKRPHFSHECIFWNGKVHRFMRCNHPNEQPCHSY